ncbi:MAG: flagellar hook-basal body complex protein FliE [Candidatus Symbiobacter sp.]|nr:flagellar hook-basal body complex protein FliE [Candidatus Symbiobacter sp.]
MPDISPASAVAAYGGTARAALDSASAMPKRGLAAPDFGSMLEQVGKNALDIGEKAESLSAKAITGQAEMTDVVTAVSSAELTLQTVVAVRDKVVTAYQEIMRMPI